MTAYFADASYWLALATPADQHHKAATEYASILASRPQDRIVTTQLVLNEVLNPRSGTRSRHRLDIIKLVDEISQNPGIDIVPQTPEQFADALAMLRTSANDKEWSITDCASFLVMYRYDIQGALTGDRHFEQAGFAVMLR